MTQYVTIKELVETSGTLGPVESIPNFISTVREVSDLWQREDWTQREKDEDDLLNNVRLVGQTWFRGHANSTLSLKPELYRDSTVENLANSPLALNQKPSSIATASLSYSA